MASSHRGTMMTHIPPISSRSIFHSHRRTSIFHSCFFFVFTFLCLLLLSPSVNANLMGVDLGESYIKVSVARPGKGLELVTNEQAKRKTPAAVGFTDENERLFGDAAVAYAAKAPRRVILNGRSLLGLCDTSSDLPSSTCTHKQHELDSDSGNVKFSGEQIVAMLLTMARKQASAFLGGNAVVKDVAVTVPEWYDERQRLAIHDAAKIIGMNCLGVVNANTAAAIKYALDGKAKSNSDSKSTSGKSSSSTNDKNNKKKQKHETQTILFFDVGAASASASVIQIITDAKTGIASSVKVLSHASNTDVGGRHLDEVVLSRLADAFDEQRKASSSSFTPARELPRVMTRLRKEAQKKREVLSANSETYVSVASLHDDIDLRTTLKRDDFEDDAKDTLSLVAIPVKTALSNSGLTTNDLDAVVPFGGASRTPRIQQVVMDALGVSSLNKSINTDEAAVMGCAFFAASMSSTFRVRKMDIEDVYRRGVSIEIDRDSQESGGLFSGSGKKKKEFQTVQIFPDTGSKMPAKKTVSFNRNQDFSLRIFLNLDPSGMSRFSERSLYAKVDVKGVAKVLEKMEDKKKAKNTTPRIAISFHIDKSGLVRIGTAESSVDETVVVEREVEVKEESKNDKKSGAKESPSGFPSASASSDDDDKEKNTKDNSEKSSETEDEKKEKTKKKKTRIEKSTQTVVHRSPLTIEFVSGEGIFGMQMNGKELEGAQKVLKDLETADRERVERADAFNALEGFILEIRSLVRSVDEGDQLYSVSTEEERDNIVSLFDEAEDWMYTSEAKQIGNLRKKHHELQKLFSPMESRANELEKRPKLLKEYRSALNESLQRLVTIREAHVASKSEHVKQVDNVIESSKETLKWLDEKETQQEKTPLTEAPVVTCDEITKKVEKLAMEITRVVKLEIPVDASPKVVPAADDVNNEDGKKNEGDDESTTDDKKKSNATDAESDTTAETGEESGNTAEEGAEVPPNPDADTAKTDGSGTSGSTAKDEL